jgi:tetratricopeptide (TPR) repeat protein
VIYTKEGEYRKAKEVLERALSSSPRLTQFFNLGVVALGMKDLEEAMRYLDLVTRIDPTDLDYLYQKAQVYLLAGRTEEGLDILRGIIAKDSSYYQAHIRLGEHFEANGERDKALEHYEGALSAIKRRLEGLLDQLKQPLLGKAEYERIKGEAERLKKAKEAVEAAIQTLRAGSQTLSP